MLCTPGYVEYICALVTVYWNCPFTYSYILQKVNSLGKRVMFCLPLYTQPLKQCLAHRRFSKNTVHRVNKDTEGMA